jgi:hypothetical protein
MTLGEVIKNLKARNPDSVLSPAFGSPSSYRGYYEQIAFAPKEWSTAREMLIEALWARGRAFTGYKGGSYEMDEDTICCIAKWGECNIYDEEYDYNALIKVLDNSKETEDSLDQRLRDVDEGRVKPLSLAETRRALDNNKEENMTFSIDDIAKKHAADLIVDSANPYNDCSVENGEEVIRDAINEAMMKVKLPPMPPPKGQIRVHSILILKRTHATDILVLDTDRPNGCFPFEGDAHIRMEVASQTGVEYCAEHFPGVLVRTTKID